MTPLFCAVGGGMWRRVIIMRKSCIYCGRIHPEAYKCPRKPQKLRYDQATKQRRFRQTRAWKNKTKEIMARDRYLCQACLAEMPGTVRKYNAERLSVHHIASLNNDFERCLDNENLVTLCSYHHRQADNGQISKKELFRIVIYPPEG